MSTKKISHPHASPTKQRKPPVIDRLGVALNTEVAPTETTTPTSVLHVPAKKTAVSTKPAVAAPSGASAPKAVHTSKTTTPKAASSTSADDGEVTESGSTIPVMNAPPKVKVPAPPAGFVPVNAIDLRGYRPMQSELASVPESVKELLAFPNWSSVFGITAEPAKQIAQRLEVASQWTALYAASTDWETYVKSQEGMAWKDALESIEALKPAFALASTANPSMLKQYPSLGRLLGAQKVVAKRGVSTRIKNKKAEAKKAELAAAANQSTAAATTAASGSSESAANGGRVVTVTG
jgi:hypothetical protein